MKKLKWCNLDFGWANSICQTAKLNHCYKTVDAAIVLTITDVSTIETLVRSWNTRPRPIDHADPTNYYILDMHTYAFIQYYRLGPEFWVDQNFQKMFQQAKLYAKDLSTQDQIYRTKILLCPSCCPLYMDGPWDFFGTW